MKQIFKKNRTSNIEFYFFAEKLDENIECKEFIEKIVPEAFRKVSIRNYL